MVAAHRDRPFQLIEELWQTRGELILAERRGQQAQAAVDVRANRRGSQRSLGVAHRGGRARGRIAFAEIWKSNDLSSDAGSAFINEALTDEPAHGNAEASIAAKTVCLGQPASICFNI